MLTKLFRANALTASQAAQIASDASDRLGLAIGLIEAEWCFYIEHKEPFDGRELVTLDWLLSETFEPYGFSDTSRISATTVLEVGPRLNFETPFSSTAVAICHKCGLYKVTRLERSIRYGLDVSLDEKQGDKFLAPLYDRMVEMRYCEPLTSLGLVRKPESVQTIVVMADNWRENLQAYAHRSAAYGE